MTHSNDRGGIGISGIGSPISGDGCSAADAQLNSIQSDDSDVANEPGRGIAPARSLPLSTNA